MALLGLSPFFELEEKKFVGLGRGGSLVSLKKKKKKKKKKKQKTSLPWQ